MSRDERESYGEEELDAGGTRELVEGPHTPRRDLMCIECRSLTTIEVEAVLPPGDLSEESLSPLEDRWLAPLTGLTTLVIAEGFPDDSMYILLPEFSQPLLGLLEVSESIL